MGTKMKRLIKSLSPPILLRFYRRFKGLNSKFFSTYEEAKANCKSSYEDSELIDLVVQKNLNFKKCIQAGNSLEVGDFKILAGVGAVASSGSLKVLDFGGGGGYHYFIAKKFLGEKFRFDWRIVETKSLVEIASQVIADDELKFFTNIENAGMTNLDLVFTSGALQYMPDPLKTLSDLLALNSRYIFITRTPLSAENGKKITIQKTKLYLNGPGPVPNSIQYKNRKIMYPITYVSQDSFEDLLKTKYQIRFKIDEGHESFFAGTKKFAMTGYFCERLG
jgi:putative methyltransferase (TIGR04325 family)